MKKAIVYEGKKALLVSKEVYARDVWDIHQRVLGGEFHHVLIALRGARTLVLNLKVINSVQN